MERNRGVLWFSNSLQRTGDPKLVHDHLLVFTEIDSFVCVASSIHDKAYCVFVFPMRITLTSAHFEGFAAQVSVEPSKELRDRFSVLVTLVVEQQYTPYAQGMLILLWREVLNQEADGKARAFFVTLPQYDANIEDLRQAISTELKESGNMLEGILIGKEPHEDGMKHTHYLFKCAEACRLNLPALWERIGAMGQVQRVVDEQKVAAYVLKGYTEGSRDYYASGSCVLPSGGDKQSFNDVLDELIQLVLHKKVNPWSFLHDKGKSVHLTALRNRKALEQLCSMFAASIPNRVFLSIYLKSRGTFLPIWDWVRKLGSGELRNPKNPSRHLFLTGTLYRDRVETHTGMYGRGTALCQVEGKNYLESDSQRHQACQYIQRHE